MWNIILWQSSRTPLDKVIRESRGYSLHTNSNTVTFWEKNVNLITYKTLFLSQSVVEGIQKLLQGVIFFTHTYYETWTSGYASERMKLEAFEYRVIPKIKWVDIIENEEVIYRISEKWRLWKKLRKRRALLI